MSKIEKNPETSLEAVTEPVKALSLMPTADGMNEGFEAPKTSTYFPFMEMVFPIMVNPDKPHYKGHEFHMGFVNGTEFTRFPAGTVFTLVDKRNSVKKVEKVNGETKNEYAYAGITRKTQVFDKSAGLYNELALRAQSSDNIHKGFTMVVIALFPDGKTAVVDFSAYKTMEGYLYPALSVAMLTSKPSIGLRIDIEDHTPNLTKSKAGFFYPDSKKFKQWSHVQLTAEQLSKAIEAFSNMDKEYENWLKR